MKPCRALLASVIPFSLPSVARAQGRDRSPADALFRTEAMARGDLAPESLQKGDFRVAYAREQLAALERSVQTVTVTLSKDSSGARVLRDGAERSEYCPYPWLTS